MRKATVIEDTGSVVYKLGLSPRPKPLKGAAALRHKQEQSLLVPRQGPHAPPPPWVEKSPTPVAMAPLSPPAPQDALEKELSASPRPRDVRSDYSGMSAALSRAVIEHRLKTAQEREERLELILAKQRGRREQVQKMLDCLEQSPAPAPVEPASDAVLAGSGAKVAPLVQPPLVKSASHLKRGPLSAAFQMA